MSYLLDTDICSAYLKGNGRIFNRFVQHSGGLFISIVSVAEMYSWVFVAVDSSKRRNAIDAMLSDVVVVYLSEDVAIEYGKIDAILQHQGKKVATADLLIGSTAIHHDLTVVTHNVRHFQMIPNLRIEDWLT